MVKRLVQAAVLAAVLIPLGSVAVEGSSIYCGFYGASNTCGGSPTSRIFDFGNYEVILDFAFFPGSTPLQPFTVGIMDDLVSNSEVANRMGGLNCIPINGGSNLSDNCVEFELIGDVPEQGVDFLGDYRIDIIWSAATDPLFPDAPGGRVRLLHDSSLVPGNLFADITIPGSYFVEPPCSECIDPGIGGRDDNFQSFIVGHVPIPEPATLLLLGSGLGGALYHRLRRRRDADKSPRA